MNQNINCDNIKIIIYIFEILYNKINFNILFKLKFFISKHF